MSAEAAHATTCPAVQMNFVNGPSCIRQQGCAAKTYSSARFALNSTMLREFYRLSGKYVYYVTGLRLEDAYAVSPCTGRSRWRKHATACGAGAAAAETNLDSGTKSTIGGYITASPDTASPFVRDIEVVTGTCNALLNGVSAMGARIEISGVCWEHVHPHEFNVYDFSYWTVAHEGNGQALAAGRPNPIAKHAEQLDAVNIDFPSHHVMKRWKDNQEKHRYIGRLDESVDFRYLATSVQSQQFAMHVGALGVTVDDGAMACGSRAEASNQPQHDHRYHIHTVEEDKRTWNQPQAGLFKTYHDGNGKSMVWTNVVLSATDQLRQRTAWALSQIYVNGGKINFAEIESYANFMDILVRNAFGSLRDVIREVSYSPVMAMYLTYQGNRKFASRGTYPDENYARESMQLFSIGLNKLNIDGTVQLGPTGQPLQTYDNDDIQTMARLWTGFDLQPPRGNIAHYYGDGAKNVIVRSHVPLLFCHYRPRYASIGLLSPLTHCGTAVFRIQ
jgi:hypothetical protein